MNAMKRYALVACALITSGAPLAHAATYSTSSPSPMMQLPPGGAASGQADSTVTAQAVPGLDAGAHTRPEVTRAPRPRAPIQSGNNFNWLQGGGG